MSSVLQRVDTSLRGRVSPQEWEARVNLAALYRLAAHYGWTDLVYTHISARVPGSENHYLINPFGFAFDEITASSLVKIDLEGNKVDPSPHPIHRAGFVIHSAIHAARPDAHCVMHSHTRAGMAVSMMKCGLLPLTQHAQMFYGLIAYHDSEGFAVDTDERARLARSLGDKPVLILRNHGTLIAARDVPLTFSLMSHLEKAMQAQIDGQASGQELTTPRKEVSEQVARLAFCEEISPGVPNPIGMREWPAALRLLDRMDASFRD